MPVKNQSAEDSKGKSFTIKQPAKKTKSSTATKKNK